jgi:hypothetical protein
VEEKRNGGERIGSGPGGPERRREEPLFRGWFVRLYPCGEGIQVDFIEGEMQSLVVVG